MGKLNPAVNGPWLVLILSAALAGHALAAEVVLPIAASAVPRDPMGQVRKNAEKGDQNAQYELGCAYNGDAGWTRDPAAAAQWWARAAAQGLSDAQYCLGLSYYMGQGVPKDAAVAAQWWEKAAEQNHAAAQYFLGLCYWAGIGVAQSPPRARYWMREAATNGNESAAAFLRKTRPASG
jgi:hypothetical protein